MEGFNLPIFYICGKIVDEEEVKSKIFCPIGGKYGRRYRVLC